ncbi:MAG: hypothetical protein ACOH2R_17295 [Pseudomonas sp.]
MTTTMQNKFILSAAAAHLVAAYRKTIAEYQALFPLALSVCPNAPDNYEALVYEAHTGALRVSPEHNKSSIYGASGNLTFRVMHDYGHLLYGKRFELADELELARIQWVDLKVHLPEGWVDVCHAVYMADTQEQSKFEAETGQFPVDQTSFVLGYLVEHFNNKW